MTVFPALSTTVTDGNLPSEWTIVHVDDATICLWIYVESVSTTTSPVIPFTLVTILKIGVKFGTPGTHPLLQVPSTPDGAFAS